MNTQRKRMPKGKSKYGMIMSHDLQESARYIQRESNIPPGLFCEVVAILVFSDHLDRAFRYLALDRMIEEEGGRPTDDDGVLCSLDAARAERAAMEGTGVLERLGELCGEAVHYLDREGEKLATISNLEARGVIATKLIRGWRGMLHKSDMPLCLRCEEALRPLREMYGVD